MPIFVSTLSHLSKQPVLQKLANGVKSKVEPKFGQEWCPNFSGKGTQEKDMISGPGQ